LTLQLRQLSSVGWASPFLQAGQLRLELLDPLLTRHALLLDCLPLPDGIVKLGADSALFESNLPD